MSSTGALIGDRYDEVARRGIDALASGRGNRDVAPRDGDPRWGVSAILRLNGSPADRIASFAEEARSVLGVNHILYDSRALHTTLRSFEGYRDNVDVNDERVGKYMEILTELTHGTGPIAIDYRGVVPSPAGLLVAGWPKDPESLQDLRERIHMRLAQLGGMTGPEKDAPRELFHASLCVFMGQIAEPAVATALVSDHTEKLFGTVTFDSIEVVRYKRTEEAIDIVPLFECKLAEA